MICDKLNTFCDGTSVALTAGASWQNVGDVIDLGLAARDVGNGEPLYLVISVGATGINAAGAGSLAFRLASDDSGTIHASTSTVHFTGPTHTTSTTSGNAGGALAAGKTLAVIALPVDGAAVYERYLGVQALVSTQDTTAGVVNAFLTRTPQVWKAYDAPNHL